MTRINLMPWREMRRSEQNRQLLSISIALWLLMGCAVFYGHQWVQERITQQNTRNAFLNESIAKVDKQIRKIDDLRKRKASLIARMEVVQQLQRDRSEIVHVFDDLVHKLPKGVYLTSLTKQGKRVTLQGYAQSNARISTLMRNLDSSNWFANPDLQVINVTPRGEFRISRFILRVNQTEDKARSKANQASDADTSSGGHS